MRLLDEIFLRKSKIEKRRWKLWGRMSYIWRLYVPNQENKLEEKVDLSQEK